MDAAMTGRVLVSGHGEGPILATTTPLSLWGGLNPDTGEIIDRHHPLSGANVSGRVLVMPCGRGSSTASGVLLNAIIAGHAPAAILLARVDEILALGAVVAEELDHPSIAVVVLDEESFARALAASYARVSADGRVELSRPGRAAQPVDA